MLGIDTRVARTVWTVVVIVGLLYGLYAIRSTLLVLVTAIFFSYFVYPLVELTQRRVGPRVPRDVVIAVVFAVVLGAIVLAVAVFGSRLADEVTRLGKDLPRLLDPDTLSKRVPLPHILDPFRIHLARLLRHLFQPSENQALPVAQQVGNGVVGLLTHMVYTAVVPILSYLLIRQAPALRVLVLSWADKSNRRFLALLADDINVLLSRYVRALMLLSLATLTVYSIVLSLFGVPYSLLLAALASLLEVVPVIGPLAGAIIILIIASFSGYDHVWWLAAFFVAYRILQDYVLNPYLMKQGVEVAPVLVVLGLLAGDELAGVAGIFLSVPFLALIKIIASRMGDMNHDRK